MLIGSEAKAQAELGIVLEQRVRPGRPAPLRVLRPCGYRQIGAVDRRAAGRVGDLQPVTEELGQQLEIGRLAATAAGARKLEQRLQELHAAHVGEIDARAVVERQALKEGNARARLFENGRLRREVDRLHAGIARAVRRTHLDADAAAGAVLQVDLQREAHVGIAARVDRRGLEPGRAPLQLAIAVVFGADHAVGAGEPALAALDAQVWLPHRHVVGDVALLERRGA